MPSDQHLYFRELELNGSSTLAECDIPPGATLFLKVRAFPLPFFLSFSPVVRIPVWHDEFAFSLCADRRPDPRRGLLQLCRAARYPLTF